jgi:uncharacterized protein (TIRG00374 family)
VIGARKLWIGFAVSVLLLVLFLATVDVGRMLEAVADANYFWLLPGILLYLTSVLFRTLRWQVLLRHMRAVRVGRLYPVVVIGYMANNLLPMRIGELVRSYYVGEREGISKTSALATILIERVLDALTLLFFIAGIALFVPLGGLAEAFGDRFGVTWLLLVTLVSLPFVVAFCALLLLAFHPARTQAVALVLIGPLPRRFRAQLRGLIEMFLQGLVPLRSPRTLALLLLISVPIWLFESALFFCVGLAFGLDHVYDNLGEMAVANVLVTATANIGSSVPGAPGGIGLFELVARETLVVLPMAPVDRSVAGGFAVVVHASLLLPMILLGQVFLAFANVSLLKLFRAGRDDGVGLPRQQPEGRRGPEMGPATRGKGGTSGS